MRKRRLLLLVGLLVALSLACSAISLGRGGGMEDEDSASAAVTVEVAPEQTDDVDDSEDTTTDVAPTPDDQDAASDDEPDDDASEALVFDAAGLDQLTSYRATLTYQVTQDNGTVEAFSMEQAATRDPKAQRFTMASTDGDIEYIQIEDQMWIRFGDDWIQGSADDMDDTDFGSFLGTSEDWLSQVDEDDYDYLGKETVNGVSSRHYRVTYAAGWLGFLDEIDPESGIDRGIADVWIADESGLPAFVVRYRVEITGDIDGEQGSIALTQDVTEVNQPLVIEPPEGVAMGGLPEGVPLYPGATDLASFGTMTTFSVPDDLDAVVDFYEDALASAGWTQAEGGMVIEGMANSNWTKGGEQLTLTATADDDGTVTVLVMLGE